MAKRRLNSFELVKLFCNLTNIKSLSHGSYIRRQIRDYNESCKSFINLSYGTNEVVELLLFLKLHVRFDKDALVCEYGCWQDDSWNWKAVRRRNLFVWELELESTLYSWIQNFNCKRVVARGMELAVSAGGLGCVGRVEGSKRAIWGLGSGGAGGLGSGARGSRVASCEGGLGSVEQGVWALVSDLGLSQGQVWVEQGVWALVLVLGLGRCAGVGPRQGPDVGSVRGLVLVLSKGLVLPLVLGGGVAPLLEASCPMGLLFSWKETCKPKRDGGLGVEDLGMMEGYYEERVGGCLDVEQCVGKGVCDEIYVFVVVFDLECLGGSGGSIRVREVLGGIELAMGGGGLAQGHVIPLMELSHELVKHGIKVTFVNTDFTHNRIVKALQEKCEVGNDIQMVSIPDGLEDGEDRNDLGKLTEALFESCIVADGNMGWALEVAKKIGIRTVAFWPASASVLILFLSLQKLIDDGTIDSDGIPAKDITVHLSPMMPAMRTTEFTWACIEPDLEISLPVPNCPG
ncbi:unnamed protein product [Lupinus luteus]|uniref:Uncharacterized protein n=1 Tax=Lupinus luteus TaxID=3873 RepID=A0AAV1XCQ8_LUPLU